MNNENKSIVDVAIAAGNFKTLAAAVQAAGLAETLTNHGPFTVFAPTDEAFAKLPEGTVEKLLKDIPKLKSILLYHVISGNYPAKQVMEMKHLKTMQGEDLMINTSDGVKVNDAKVITADIMAENGVIHVINMVLMPE